MKEPIKAGDDCLVIGGLGRGKSPNIGLRVKALSMQGEHSQFGRVWRCEGAGVKQLSDAGAYIETGWADFPTDWLEKIEPDSPPPEAVKTNEELTA